MFDHFPSSSHLELRQMDDQAVPCLGGRHLAGQPRGRLTLGVHREHLLFADAGGADLIGPLRIDDDVAGTARRFASAVAVDARHCIVGRDLPSSRGTWCLSPSWETKVTTAITDSS